MKDGRRRGFASQVEEVSLENAKKRDLEDCMLYTTGQLEVIGGAKDDLFNMLAKGQPMIQRKVQVYCWEES